MIPARPAGARRPVDRVSALDLCDARRGGGSDKAPLCDVDDRANSPRIPPHVVFRSGSFSRHARHLSLLGVDRMRIVYPAAASRHSGGFGRVSRSPPSGAHPVVGTDERLRCRFRSKRDIAYGRRVLIGTSTAAGYLTRRRGVRRHLRSGNRLFGNHSSHLVLSRVCGDEGLDCFIFFIRGFGVFPETNATSPG